MNIKKYVIPVVIGAVIGASLSGFLGYLMSFEIMIKTIMQSSGTFKLFFGALFGGFCAWIIIYNKNN